MKKILVVDDEEDYRTLLGHILRKQGYAVALAGNGAQALAAFEKERPDLVLLDVQLPDMDGFTVCRRLRAQGEGAPVLFCTVRSSVAPVAEGLNAGGSDYVVKPFEIDDLLERVRAALGA